LIAAILTLLASVLASLSFRGATQRNLASPKAGWAPRHYPVRVALLLTILGVLLWVSCGGGGGYSGGGQSNPGTAAGSFNVSISASSGSIAQAATLPITVQ